VLRVTQNGNDSVCAPLCFAVPQSRPRRPLLTAANSLLSTASWLAFCPICNLERVLVAHSACSIPSRNVRAATRWDLTLPPRNDFSLGAHLAGINCPSFPFSCSRTDLLSATTTKTTSLATGATQQPGTGANVRPCPQSVAARFPSSCNTPCCRLRQPSTPIDLQSSRPPATDASAVATDELRVDLRGRRRSCSLALFTNPLLPSCALSRVQVSTSPGRVHHRAVSLSPGHLVRSRRFGRVIGHEDKAAGRTFSFRSSGTTGSFSKAGDVRYGRTSCRAMCDHRCAACLELKRVSNTIESTLEN
jgi:hypothetical protein